MYTISHACLPHLSGGIGFVRGLGESCYIYKTGWKSVHSKNAVVYCQLSASQTSEHFLPEIKDVAFCMYVDSKKFKLVLFWPSYDLFSKAWFYYFSWSFGTCSSASSRAILNFLQDFKSPVHALFANYHDWFTFNPVFRSKMPCVWIDRADFAGFCVCRMGLSGGGGGCRGSWEGLEL